MHDRDYDNLLAAIGTGTLYEATQLRIWVQNAYAMHNGCQYIEEIESLYKILGWVRNPCPFANAREIQKAHCRVVFNCLRELAGDLTYEIDPETVLAIFPRKMVPDE